MTNATQKAGRASALARGGPNASRRGFTLIEVMLAIAIIGIGILTMSLALYDSIRSNDFSQSYTNMVTMIDDWTERFQGVQRNQVENSFGAYPSCIGVGGGDGGFVPIAVGNINEPGMGGFNQILVSPQGRLGPPPEGEGVVISYDLYAYCPPDRTEGAVNPKVPNGYQMLGRAYLVKDVNAGVGSYEVRTSVQVNSMFSDRSPAFTGF